MKRFLVLLLALAVTGIWSCKPEKPFNEKHAELIQNTKLKKANAMTMNEFIEKYDFWNLSEEQMKQLNKKWKKNENERPVLKLDGKLSMINQHYTGSTLNCLENYYSEPQKLKMSLGFFIDSQNNYGSPDSGVNIYIYFPLEEALSLSARQSIAGYGQIVELIRAGNYRYISVYPFIIEKK